MSAAVAAVTDIARPAPHSAEAERACLGAVLVEGLGALRDLDVLAIEDFLIPVNRDVLATMRVLRERGQAIDIVTVGAELRARGQVGRMEGGEAYLLSLLGQAPVANVTHHVEIVREHAARRRLIAAGASIVARAHSGADPAAEIGVEAVAHLEEIAAQSVSGSLSIAQIVEREPEELPSPVSTGLAVLDRQLGGGLYPQSVYLLPGPAGRGKSSLGYQLARAVSVDRPVVILTTELLARQVVARLAAPILGCPWLDVWRRLDRRAVMGALAGHQIRIVDAASSRARTVRDALTGASVVIVDYLQDLARRRQDDRDARHVVAAASDEIRGWALDTGGTAIVVSSAARVWGDSRTGADRQTRDYAAAGKEAGELESDAAAVIAVDIEPCPAGGVTTATLRVAKSRYFTPGEIRLEYVGALGFFRPAAGSTLTPLEAEILAVVRSGATTRTAVAKECGGRKADVLKTIKEMVARGVLNADLTFAEGLL